MPKEVFQQIRKYYLLTVSTSRLCEGTINAVRIVKDVMRCHGGLSTTMSVTPALVRRAQGAHSRLVLLR